MAINSKKVYLDLSDPTSFVEVIELDRKINPVNPKMTEVYEKYMKLIPDPK